MGKHFSTGNKSTDNVSHKKPLTILYFGTYRAEYSRNRIMINGLRLNGVKVIECHAQLWRGINDRVNLASGGWISPLFWWRIIRTYSQLILKFLKIHDYDVIVLGYPGQFDIFLMHALRFFHKKPICWDVLMSIYLVALERKLNQKSTFTVNILRNVEKKACTLADLMVIESEEYIDWFVQTHNAERDKFWLVPLGAEEGRIIPFDIPNEVNFRSDKLFTVIYWGTFIQNHGVEVMVDAACSLKDIPEINFLFIGTGPERSLMMEKALGIGLKNVSFPGWVDENELMIKINKADLCLGIFGNTPQSHMTIQNKIYECLAMRKPLVTGKSKVISKNFIHGMHMFCCERDPDSLAESILFLKDQPEVLNKIANEGYRYYLENYSNKKIGLHFLNGLLKLCSKKLLND